MNHEMNTSNDGVSPITSSDTMAGMSMSTIFSTQTRITLFFTGWTTASTAAYVATIFFLFLLAFFNRFLGALKFQVERARWEKNVDRNTLSLPPSRSHTRVFVKAKLSPRPTYLARDGESEWDPLAPHIHREATDGPNCGSSEDYLKEQDRVSKSSPLLLIFGSWKPSGPWQIKMDGLRAMMEFTRAFIGYIL